MPGNYSGGLGNLSIIIWNLVTSTFGFRRKGNCVEESYEEETVLPQ